jgi:hypothetical protein
VEHFTKLDSSGNSLPIEATTWVGVLDNRTDLIWPRKLKICDDSLPWKKAIAAADSFSVCGMPARAATVEEAFMLADRSKRNPAIDTRFFDVDTDDWYWTSTPLAGVEESHAWSVYFGNGYADYHYQLYEAFVLAVCSARASQ